MNIVIIGGGASGLTTASNIRKYDDESQIIVFTTQKNVAYSPCAIPYVIGGHIDSFDDIIMHKPGEYMRKNIRIMTETTVTSIDKDNTEITYKTKDSETDEKIKYDKLVIATGGKPLIPPIPGKDLKGVFKVRTVEDGKEIQNYAQNAKRVVLVGGGAIGLELGSELANKGLDVTIAEMMPQLFPRSFDKEMSDKFQKHLQDKNVTILTGSAVQSINGDEKVESVTIDGEERPADMVILSTGVRPQTELAESIGCELGQFAIDVDEHMETSVENVYAAGDCVEVTSAITGEKTLSPLGTTAVRQGIILARHLVGHDLEFKPVLNSTVSQIGIMEMGAVGITQQEAEKNGIDVVVSNVDSLSRARYYPGSKPLFLKLIAKLDGTIIGCQMFGQEAVAERVDTMTTIISQKLTCDEVVTMEFSYAPPVSQVIDPLAQAAAECLEKIEAIEDQKQLEAEEKQKHDIEVAKEEQKVINKNMVQIRKDDAMAKIAEQLDDIRAKREKIEEPTIQTEQPPQPTVSFTQLLRQNQE
ncbi:FAD-dependent oxidoreductase [uncultured Methanosphaera sp.]|uniref:NAD(P)/FAD-dependent oxidoreductase n=1 Tax=uncultured Methanosphaera sp. TaxID=262501 RepID=UPI00280634D9|nr:FAD-dependent oxidoreductase [uncultured Methanosphaera sp.]